MIEPYLNITKSVTGKRWQLRDCDERNALMISQRHELPVVLARALSIRQVDDARVPLYLDPRIRDWMPDPFSMARMDDAVDALLPIIERQGCVGIFGDYDVDGATSSAVLATFLRRLGVTVHIHIPSRFTEGYGPNMQAFESLREKGAEIIITLDCGVTAFDVLEQAQDAGMDVLVIDHHQGEPNLPPAVAVVNPNCLDDTSGLGYLAAVGVTFLLVVAVNSRLRNGGLDGLDNKEILSYLDRVALGTVCDIVPLKDLNRAIVAQGLKVMHNRQNIGLTALCDGVGVDSAPNTYHLGFLLGPRINAGGRLGDSDLGVQLLCEQNKDTATSIALKLNALNAERQDIQEQCLNQALEQAETVAHAVSPYGVYVASPDWHSGVIGIVAGRLKDTYNRPACVTAIEMDENGRRIGKGSGRSVRGIDLGTAIIAARQNGLLMAGGGHAMAAGYTVDMDKYDDFVAFLNDRIGGQVDGGEIIPTLSIDGEMSVAGATLDFVHTLAKLEPFGAENSEPRFAFKDLRVTHTDILKDKHIRFTVKDDIGNALKGMAFNCASDPMGQTLLDARGGTTRIHAVGKIRLNSWQGKDSVQFLLDDIAVV